jgi:hypothetical protein
VIVKRSAVPLLLLAGGLLLPVPSAAQDVQPRSYTPAPVGVNVVSLTYVYSDGPVLFDKTLPIEDAVGTMHSLNLGYSRTLGIADRSARVDLGVPWVTGSWEGVVLNSTGEASRTGFGDPLVRFSWYVVGAPALTGEEFARFHPRTVLGVALRVRVPLGQYDAKSLVNLGSNRWSFSPHVGVSHVTGRFLLEAQASAWYFTSNPEFLGTGNLTQKPLYALQGHVGYLGPRGWWIAVSSRQSLGGSVSVDGGDYASYEANNRIGLTVAAPVGGRYSLRFAATTDLAGTVGNQYDTFLVSGSVAF